MTTALLLAAGNATRLGDIRKEYAKANVPVAGTTPLRFAFQALRDAGYKRVWVNLHYKAEQVREQAMQFASDLEICFLDEERLLGTGGTLLEVYKRDAQLPQLMLNAKIFGDFDLREMLSAAPGSLMLHPKTNADAFGGLYYAANMQIEGLSLKGSSCQPELQRAVFTGICTPHPLWVEHLQQAHDRTPKELLCLIRDGLVPALSQDKTHAKAILHRGDWCEISTAERVAEASRWLQSKANRAN
ncbi:MAG: NDP-sugar pyrophosphorylase family protein [Myxococcota bacterium]|jgi:NDP-sugar pyrophosphorylase family protein